MGSRMSAGKNGAIVLPPPVIPAAVMATRIRPEMIPLNNLFSYFFSGASPTEEERREYLDEPIAALPPKVTALLPPTGLLFVPFLERSRGRKNGADQVSAVRPPHPVSATRASFDDGQVLLFAFEDRDVGEYHYRFFQAMAAVTAERMSAEVEGEYLSLIRNELRNNIHGEVDEVSWEMKMALLERQSKFHGSNKSLRDYAGHSFIDTMTLYLHGICCDLDVETGPRQLASRHLRKRLELLEREFPPPSGYAVFPEDLKN
jgi:hypothetical protein